jgi:hypothetical protein
MDLITDGVEVAAEQRSAMQRGLDAVDKSDETVVVTDDFVGVVEDLEQSTGYDADRGTGTVAGKTVRTPAGDTVIVLNGEMILSRPTLLIERLLAHEGGHASLHQHDEATDLPGIYEAFSSGIATLHATAAIGYEEFRIERRLAELGYPLSERAEADSLDEQLLELAFGVANAARDPASQDPGAYARSVLTAMSNVTVTLAYLAGSIVGGAARLRLDQLSTFGKQTWSDVMRRSWRDRLELYQRIPAIGTPLDRHLISAHLRSAALIDRKLVHDLGFSIQGGSRPDESGRSYVQVAMPYSPRGSPEYWMNSTAVRPMPLPHDAQADAQIGTVSRPRATTPAD